MICEKFADGCNLAAKWLADEEIEFLRCVLQVSLNLPISTNHSRNRLTTLSDGGFILPIGWGTGYRAKDGHRVVDRHRVVA